MTPSSLDPAKGAAQPQRMSISIQRPEEPPRKKSLFGLFRSKSREARDREALESGDVARQQPPGPSQRAVGTNKLRSTRQPFGSAAAAAAGLNSKPDSGQENARLEKPIPPPITIPPPSAFALAEMSPSRFHSVRVKTKRYRTMSSASVEALDGTAVGSSRNHARRETNVILLVYLQNNTVVGSPTSSMRSQATGPLTPPLRDAVEAAKEWRNIDRNFMDRGASRRRRPGVTFDVMDEDVPKTYRLHRASRLYGSGDLSE